MLDLSPLPYFLVCWMKQAMKLAEYKPVLDVQHLSENLQRVHEITDDAHRFFNNTRLVVVYYEDLVMEPKVGP